MVALVVLVVGVVGVVIIIILVFDRVPFIIILVVSTVVVGHKGPNHFGCSPPQKLVCFKETILDFRILLSQKVNLEEVIDDDMISERDISRLVYSD